MPDESRIPIVYGNLKERIKTGTALVGGTAAIDGLRQLYHSLANSEVITDVSEQISQIPGIDYLTENVGELGLELAAAAAIIGYFSHERTNSLAFFPNSDHAFDDEREHIMRRLESVVAMAAGGGIWAHDKVQGFIEFYWNLGN